MIAKVVVEWKYDPKNYFEENIIIKNDNYEIIFNEGLVSAKIDPDFFHDFKDLMDTLQIYVESRFVASQLTRHKPFKLSKPSRHDLRTDGKRNIYLSASMKIKTSISNIDLVVKDKSGKVLSDPKKERIDKGRWFAEKVAKYRSNDSVLDQMLKSYNMSVNEPKNELVYLYEILEAASKKFEGKRKALAELQITDDEWSSLGRIANELPYTQGRHRGRNPGILRKAEESELKRAREIAVKIVENYLIYLDKMSNG